VDIYTVLMIATAHEATKLIFAVLDVSLNDGPYTAIFRPLDIVCRRTYILPGSSFFLFYSSANLRARWTELNDNLPHASTSTSTSSILSECVGS